jgi:hypothetical protein
VLRVTVELWPHGDHTSPQIIGTLVIANDGASPTPEVGHYNYVICGGNNDEPLRRSGTLQDFPRRRLGAWALIARVLQRVVGED